MINRFPRIREDLMLVYDAVRKMTGANVHRGRALIAAYQNAIDIATDQRNSEKKKAAVLRVRLCEEALRVFQ